MPRLFERNELSRRWDSLPISPLGKKMIEIYSVSFASSALFTSLFIVGVVPQSYIGCVFCAASCIFLNFIWLAYRTKRSIDSGMEVGDCRGLYLRVFAVHAVLNMILALFEAEPVYTWFFLPYKLFGFGRLDRWASAMIINFVMLAANYYFPAVPFWLERIQKKPLKKGTIKFRKFKKPAIKKKGSTPKIKRRTVKFSRKGGKRR